MTYGTLTMAGGDWVVDCTPASRAVLKRLFPKVLKSQYGAVNLLRNPSNTADLHWFSMRYPLRMDEAVEKEFLTQLRAHFDLKQAIVELDSNPRKFEGELALKFPLRHYQETAVQFWQVSPGALLADNLGLGKTVTAIGTLSLASQSLPAVVVVPTHLQIQWRDDFIKRFLPDLKCHIIAKNKQYPVPEHDVLILSYSKLSSWAEWILERKYKSVVFDECQHLRHPTTDRYQAAKAVRLSVEKALGLSATPIYNYGGEVFNVVDLLAPDSLGSFPEFAREWCSMTGNGKYLVKEPEILGAHLREEGLLLRRTREDVGLELPPINRVVQTVPHDPHVLDRIKTDATELAKLVLGGDFHRSGMAARELDLKLRQATGISKAVFVAHFVKMLLENGEAVILFGWHREVYEIWNHELAEFNPVMYTGSESSTKKRQAVLDFEEGRTNLFIMSLRSGEGVDGLQKRSPVVVFGELDWSPKVHDQNIGRAARDGSVGSTLAVFLVSESGSDPIVSEILGLKDQQSAGIFDLKTGDDPLQSAGDTARMRTLAQKWLQSHA